MQILLLDKTDDRKGDFPMKMKKEQEIAAQAETQNDDDVQATPEESTGKRILNTVVNVVLVLAIALAAICTYVSYVSTSGNGVPSILGIRMFSIQTESMYPTLLPGDLIFDTGVKDASELRAGDIITYWTVINGERVLNTHRIEEVYDGGGYLIFATKGDNNSAADALTVHESEIVGKYSFRVSGAGKVFDYLQTSTGFLIVVVIPVFLFFLFHLVQFFRVLFEYQNVKNRIKYEQERGRTEDLIAEQQRRQQEAQANARAKMEAELRERLRAELLASMAAEKAVVQPEPEETAVSAEEAPAEETPAAAEEENLAEETHAAAAEETPAEETPAAVEEEHPAEETPAEEEKPAVMDEAAIEALIAKQREAIEAELREKLRAEFMASMSQDPSADAAKTEENVEDAAQV